MSMSPEVLRGQYTSKADIWSMGTIAYVLLSGTRPFEASTNRELQANILDGKYAPMTGGAWDKVSTEAKEFCQLLLTYNDTERPDAKQALSHPWLRRTAKEVQPTAAAMARIHNSLLLSLQHILCCVWS